jgi:hypothetical protein
MERLLAKMDATQAMVAKMKIWREEATTCQGMTEACLESKESTSLEVGPEAKHEEVRKDEAAVKSSGALKKRHRGLHLAAGRRGKLEKHTQSKSGSRKKLAADRRGTTRRLGVAWRKGRAALRREQWQWLENEHHGKTRTT